MHETPDATTFGPEYFAQIAELEARHPWSQAMRTLTLALVDREAHGPLRRVLDVGCGAGAFLDLWLAGHSETTQRPLRDHSDTTPTPPFGVGIDLYADALGWARRRPRGTWVRASAGAPPFRDGSFDAIHCADVLQHLSLDDSARAIDAFARLLRPDGLLALRVRAPRILRSEPDVDYAHAFSRHRIASELARREFRIAFLSHVNALPSLWAELAAGAGGAQPGGAVKGIQHRPDRSASAQLLSAYLRLERGLLLNVGVPMPFGHTLICIARKDQLPTSNLKVES